MAVATPGTEDPPTRVLEQVFTGTLECTTPFDDTREPVLLVHGTEDVNVRSDHSAKLASALERKKKSVELVEYEGIDHYFRRNRERIDMLDRVGAFLDAHIGKPVVKN